MKKVINRASVYGNIAGLKNPVPIKTASRNTYNAITSPEMNHSATLSTSADKKTILANIPANTVFYIATHASHFSFSDCTGSSSDAASLFTTNDPTGNSLSVAEAVKQKGNQPIPYPPYNFVFIDGCASAQYPDFAYAFGVKKVGYTLGDHAFVGWNVSVLNVPQLANWTTSLWNSLRNGMTLNDAVSNADHRYPQPLNKRLQKPRSVMIGDHQMRLRGLYKSSGTSFFKALP